MKSKHQKATRFISQGLFKNINSFKELEQRITNLPLTERGDAFEVFAEAYFATQKLSQAAEIWPDNSIPFSIRNSLGLTSNEADRKKQIQGLKDRIKDQQEKIARCDEMLLNRDIDRETHQRMIPKLKEEIAILRKKVELQESSETGFMKYCRFGIPLLSNLSGFYKNANVAIKQKILGSIFQEI